MCELGGASLNIAIATGGSLVVKKGDDILKLINQTSGRIFQNTNELNSAGQMIFRSGSGTHYVLNESGSLYATNLLWGSWKDYSKITVKGREYAKIVDRQYTSHAVDRMQPGGLGTPIGADGAGRNVSPNLVVQVIVNGTPSFATVDGIKRTIYTSENVSIVTENGGKTIVTILRTSTI